MNVDIYITSVIIQFFKTYNFLIQEIVLKLNITYMWNYSYVIKGSIEFDNKGSCCAIHVNFQFAKDTWCIYQS